MEINYNKRLKKVASILKDRSLLLSDGYSSFFYYLTGFNLKSAILINGDNLKNAGVYLFIKSQDEKSKIWDGKYIDISVIKSKLYISDHFDFDNLWDKLPSLLQKSSGIYLDIQKLENIYLNLIKYLKKLKKNEKKYFLIPIFDIDYIEAKMKMIKSDIEIKFLKKSADITSNTLNFIIKFIKHGIKENIIEAEIYKKKLELGADGLAFPTIIASGKNACILHYNKNNCFLNKNDMLLIDTGSKYKGYCSDISRTYPISGKFKSYQKDLYNIVLNAQKNAFNIIKPGITLIDINEIAVDTIISGLKDMGILNFSLDQIKSNKLYKKYFPHKTSHWIGLDVHDKGIYYFEKKPIKLEEGMYFSVEPGLYISQDDLNVPQELRGIGIRLEDDILISKNGYEILTETAIKEIKDIEKLFKGVK